MTASSPTPERYIGLDIHKEFLVAIGVNAEQEPVFGPHKVTWGRFERWARKHLTATDAGRRIAACSK